MTDPVFVVLRAGPNSVQTVGPSGEAFASFKQAGALAKKLTNQYPQHTYFVCQTIAVYEVQHKITVKKVTTSERVKKRDKLPTRREDGPEAPCAPNVYPMREHGSRAG